MNITYKQNMHTNTVYVALKKVISVLELLKKLDYEIVNVKRKTR